ncbi:AI-2E family transporter [Candidatus Peregrinibacteria bacterium]|nr:AI-2E family transporter [Candidatus Peregrinibacteria bacterium]
MPIKHLSNAFARLQQKIQNLQARLLNNERETHVLEKNSRLPSEEKIERIIFEFSSWSVVKVVMIILTAFLMVSFLGRITNILLLLFFSAFLAIVFNPGVNRLEKWHIPRPVGFFVLLILIFSFFVGILGGLIPIIAEEVAKMWEGITLFAKKLGDEDFSGLPIWMQEVIKNAIPVIENYLKQVDPAELQTTITNFVTDNVGGYFEQFTTVAGKGLSFLAAVLGGIFQFVLVIILTFFLVVEKENITDFFVKLFPKKYEEYILLKSRMVHRKISEWIHGQIVLFFVIGIIAYVGLSIIGIKYAVTLALIAGLGEFLPYIGPIFALASAAPVAFNESFSVGIATVIFYISIQLIDGNIIIPLIMKKTVGISPVVTIIAMLIGWEFLGIVGMMMAVPLASVVSVFVSDYSPRDRNIFVKKSSEKNGIFSKK